MHIQSCENPKRIFNEYTKQYMYVPCGHCNTCNIRKSSNWVNRLKRESKCHRYTAFVTLTYSEEFCPFVDFGNIIDAPLFPQDRFRTDFSYLVEDLKDFDSRSFSLIEAGNGKVRLLNYKDIQNFFKRLRITIEREYEKEKGTKEGVPVLRYFCCGEYGPTTFRPHYHLLIWYDCDWLAERFDHFLTSCWQIKGRPLGLIDWSPVTNDASTYVAQYVNSRSHLPSMLTFPAVCPFGRGSRRPPIGTLFQSEKQVLQIFHQGLVSISVPNGEGEAPLSIPLFPSLKNRLFPKCLRYSSVSSFNRVTCYSISRRFPKREEFENEIEYLSCLKTIISHYSDYEDKSSFLYNYVDDITFHFSDIRPLIRALSISARVLAQADIFGVSLHYYCSRIDNYYLNVERRCLKDWYHFAVEYSKHNSVTDLLYQDLDFVQRAYDKISSIPSIKFDSYGLHSFAHDLSKLPLDNIEDFKQMKLLSKKIVHETSKTKKKNDYLNAHPELCYFTHL